jgi:hypothetical protein
VLLGGGIPLRSVPAAGVKKIIALREGLRADGCAVAVIGHDDDPRYASWWLSQTSSAVWWLT